MTEADLLDIEFHMSRVTSAYQYKRALSDVPALIAEVRRLTAENERLRPALVTLNAAAKALLLPDGGQNERRRLDQSQAIADDALFDTRPGWVQRRASDPPMPPG